MISKTIRFVLQIDQSSNIIFQFYESHLEIFHSNLSINFQYSAVDVSETRFDDFYSIYRNVARFVDNVKELVAQYKFDSY